MSSTIDHQSTLFARERAEKAVPVRMRQRQDSLDAQLITVLEMATRAGCYDAADWLKLKMSEPVQAPVSVPPRCACGGTGWARCSCGGTVRDGNCIRPNCPRWEDEERPLWRRCDQCAK